jgi:uncharacterized membrane protein
MYVLDILTIVCTGLMTGNELAVSLFVNPAELELDSHAMASLLARRLGKAMPLWYILCLALLIAEAYLRRQGPGRTLLTLAVAVWIATIVFTVILLVPINNQVASSEPDSKAWREDLRRWDLLHRWRILFLIAAMVCLIAGILAV